MNHQLRQIKINLKQFKSSKDNLEINHQICLDDLEWMVKQIEKYEEALKLALDTIQKHIQEFKANKSPATFASIECIQRIQTILITKD